MLTVSRIDCFGLLQAILSDLCKYKMNSGWYGVRSGGIMLLWDTWRGGVPTYPLCSFPVCGGSPGSYLPPRFVHSVTTID